MPLWEPQPGPGTTGALGKPLVQWTVHWPGWHVALAWSWVWKDRSKWGDGGQHTGRQAKEWCQELTVSHLAVAECQVLCSLGIWAWGSSSKPALKLPLSEGRQMSISAWSAPRVRGHREGRCSVTFLGRPSTSEISKDHGAQADLMQKHTTRDSVEGRPKQAQSHAGAQEGDGRSEVFPRR